MKKLIKRTLEKPAATPVIGEFSRRNFLLVNPLESYSTMKKKLYTVD